MLNYFDLFELAVVYKVKAIIDIEEWMSMSVEQQSDYVSSILKGG